MLALTTDDDNDVGSRSLDSLNGVVVNPPSSELEKNAATDFLGREDRFAFPAFRGKQRGDSFSDSRTSSNESSPAGSTWRPLGRRASAHFVTPSNQLEHQFDASPFSHNGNGNAKLQHSSGFREVVNSAMSSSESSLVDSLSSGEGSPDRTRSPDNNVNEFDVLRPSGIDTDPSYGGLSSLQEAGRNITVDTRQPPLMHVKSPVLSTRKDSQTWQMQEEELLTSPRFNFRSSLEDTSMSVFGNSLGLLADESSNQIGDFRDSHTRVTKDARASSVDFTYSRPSDMNPPLPPQQESAQRIRARSFSHSASYGATNFNPAFINKGYMPPHHPQQDFPATMRPFHSGPPPPQPGLMQGPVRPPRVSIPTDSPMHPYHQSQPVPPPPYRRYSTDFAVAPPYPDAMHAAEPEMPGHRTPTGRGIRSYSMEYFPPNPRVRTHSLEGQQMFQSVAPPTEYPVGSRHTSGGMTYEWPRSPPPAPPLPPDVHSTPRSNQYPPPPPEAYYEVEFKRGRTELFAGNAGHTPGDYVKVEADRGEDIGRLVRRITDISKITGSSSHEATSGDESPARPKRHELPSKKIMCVASPRECEMLSEQRKEEHEVFEVCKSKVRQRLLPMNVIDAEYQFDRHKLTFFFEADRRIDFRELVRDLFAIYKTRIWLQQVVPGGKKVNGETDAN
ncbi:hypothetical protein Poli38472_005520 [Pythium oligandrum]|uniref:PSP1 C-terminal domain-containing protein n=1 Tax=Pythium oligandrum TaxID=41045 RepID=A0A8K1CGG0_PYTOL|nr:hypothetical protein Poli38472_005520 [Pythium oligandrum]|eukprot:TMW62902.1 hypothetical protein Poli38472_005520 [Pythium oligandrum]